MTLRIAVKPMIVLIILFMVFIIGCERAFLVAAIPAIQKQSKKIQEYDNPRILEETLPSTIITYEGLLGIEPETRELLVLAATAYNTYAMAFVEDVDPEHAKKLYGRGKELGMRALAMNHVFADAVKSGSLAKFKSVLWVLKKRDTKALYITASNWMSWIILNRDNPEALKDLPKVEALMNRVLELDENYRYGSIHASFGALYGNPDKTMGGQPEKSRQHFEKAFKISGDKFLFFHFLYAKTYAIQIKDKKLFTDTLNKVLNAPSNQAVEMTLNNQIARLKALRLLEEADKYF